jgi:hypothetical protein
LCWITRLNATPGLAQPPGPADCDKREGCRPCPAGGRVTYCALPVAAPGGGARTCPQSAITQGRLTRPLFAPKPSMRLAMDMPSTTRPKTTAGNVRQAGGVRGYPRSRAMHPVVPLQPRRRPPSQRPRPTPARGPRRAGAAARQRNGVGMWRAPCLPSSHAQGARHRKNWEPLVLGPAFAIDSTPAASCRSTKFSSANVCGGRGVPSSVVCAVLSAACSTCLARTQASNAARAQQRGGDRLSEHLCLRRCLGTHLPVDRLPSCAVPAREVAALAHEAWDDPVKAGPLEVEALSRTTNASLASAEGSEVFHSARGHVCAEFHHHAARGLAPYLYIKPDPGVLYGRHTRGLSRPSLVAVGRRGSLQGPTTRRVPL